MKKRFSTLLIVLFCFWATILFCGCGDKSQQHPKVISVLTYSEYFPQEMITDFQMKTGYQLQLDLYEAQEEMIDRLRDKGTEKYDLIIASDVVIQQMVRLGLIAAIDTNRVPNRVNVADQFKSPAYDPSNTYTLPYLWGTTGILYRDTTISVDSVSYDMLFDSKQTKGNFSLRRLQKLTRPSSISFRRRRTPTLSVSIPPIFLKIKFLPRLIGLPSSSTAKPWMPSTKIQRYSTPFPSKEALCG